MTFKHNNRQQSDYSDTLLAQELSLHVAQLGFVIQPLVAEGLITVQGGLVPGAVAFTEKGLSEANEIINRRSPSRARTKIVCIDSEPEIVQRMKDAGYSVFDVSMGFRTGKRGFSFPAPNEADLIVCDLRRPACFDSTDWGPGRSNDNFNCKIIPYDNVSNSFSVRDDRLHALHRLIYESQLGKQIPGTFGPKEVNRAIVGGGVPFLLFLNGEWLSRMETFPNWLDVKWSFLPTHASEVEIVEPIPMVLPELGKEIKFKFAIQNRIEKGPLFSRMPPLFETSVAAIVKNNVGDVFGQFVKMGKGQVWLLPATHQSVDVIELFALRLEKVRGLVQPQQELRLVLDETVTKRSLTKTPTTKEETMPATKIKVFISHSSADADIARELINLLRSAIPTLPPDVIRCTSVSGYRLEGGAKTDEQIVIESLGTDVFIALLSKKSLESTYVLFELGARWGAGKQLVPLVVAGMSESELKPPLNALSAHSASTEDHLFQLVDEVASSLGLSLAKPPTYTAQLKKLAQLSWEEGTKRGAASSATEPSAPSPPTASGPQVIAAEVERDLLADVISELEDNLERARAPRIGSDAYARPSSQVWRNNRNRLTLPNHLRYDVTNRYRQIDGWKTVAETGVHPNMGSPAIESITADLRTQLPALIEELKKLL